MPPSVCWVMSRGSLCTRGVSGQQTCVLFVANDLGDIRVTVLWCIIGNVRLVKVELEGLIDLRCHIVTDNFKPYPLVVPGRGCDHGLSPSKPESGRKLLGMIVEAPNASGTSLRAYYGVCTRRLDHRYPSRFIWKQLFRSFDAEHTYRAA